MIKIKEDEVKGTGDGWEMHTNFIRKFCREDNIKMFRREM
jgi:hypothetical protein